MNSPKTKGGDPRQSQKTELEGPLGQEPHEGWKVLSVITGLRNSSGTRSPGERGGKKDSNEEESAEGRSDS